jgi:predicted TIM-barrel fold metal-dependent hydrolase
MSNKVIDFHAHIFPDELALRGVESLYDSYRLRPHTDGTASGLLDSMDKAGISYSVTQPVATKASQVSTINDLAATSSNARLIRFGSIHVECDCPEQEIERAISLSLKGIKIQGNWQGFAVDDPRLYTAYEYASGRLVFMYHAGTEIAPIDMGYAAPARIANVKRLFPKLDIVAAHMGGFRAWKQAWDSLVGTGVYLDTSSSLGLGMETDEFLDMIRIHGAERILFATDSPILDQAQELEKVRSSGLTDIELEKILWSNGAGLLGLQ